MEFCSVRTFVKRKKAITEKLARYQTALPLAASSAPITTTASRTRLDLGSRTVFVMMIFASVLKISVTVTEFVKLNVLQTVWQSLSATVFQVIMAKLAQIHAILHHVRMADTVCSMLITSVNHAPVLMVGRAGNVNAKSLVRFMQTFA